MTELKKDFFDWKVEAKMGYIERGRPLARALSTLAAAARHAWCASTRRGNTLQRRVFSKHNGLVDGFVWELTVAEGVYNHYL